MVGQAARESGPSAAVPSGLCQSRPDMSRTSGVSSLARAALFKSGLLLSGGSPQHLSHMVVDHGPGAAGGERVYYNSIIPLPLSLGYILARLQGHFYRQPAALLQDLDTLESNATLFNGPDSAPHQRGWRWAPTLPFCCFSQTSADCQGPLGLAFMLLLHPGCQGLPDLFVSLSEPSRDIAVSCGLTTECAQM